jgi:probable HAF family extracellular repeat protein
VKTHASVATMVCLLLLATASPLCAAQTSYTITDLGTLSSNGFSEARAINATAEVTGLASEDNNLINDVFVYSDGVMSSLGTLGGMSASATELILPARSQGIRQIRQALTAPSSPTARRSSISAIWAAALRLGTELTTWGRWSGRRPQPREKIILSCTALER